MNFKAFLLFAFSIPLFSQPELCGPVAITRDMDLVPVSVAKASKPPPAGNWSNPATWPGGVVPAAGSSVLIPTGKEVTLDVSPPHLASITVDGTLKVAAKPIELITGYILVRSGGKFIAGSTTKPFANYLTITLTGTDRQATTMGGRVFGVMGGGVVELIAKVPTLSWTLLANGSTADKGANTLTLETAPGWKTNDWIIITSTDFDYEQTEKRRIKSINGNVVTLNAALSYLHYGNITTVPHDLAGVSSTIDERADVGLLTRYIKIQGAQGIPGVEDSETNGYGGHFMVMEDASVARLQGVELYNMGQKGLLGRYPMHWHNVNDGGVNSFMRHCSTHHSFNRGTTIHKTNKLTLSNNVIYDTIGHGYFMEDGKETGNVFDRNLVAVVRKSPMDLHWDTGGSGAREQGTPAAYWITNPNNTFTNNVAAGSIPGGFGFWYDLAPTPRPGSISNDPNYHPNQQPFGVFRNNRAHSIGNTFSYFFDGAWALFFERLENDSPVVIEGFTSFKVQNGQVWAGNARPETFSIIRSSLSGDQAMRAAAKLKDSLVVGRTANPVVKVPDEHLKNMRLSDFDTTIGNQAITGYDAVGQGEGCVFANYRGVFPIRNTGDAGGNAFNSVFINDGVYRTGFVANSFNLSQETVEKSLFTMENIEDSFGNGGPGMFTYAELYTDQRSLRAPQAKGLEPTDTLGWWSPVLESDFATVSFDRGSEPPYRLSNQPASKQKTFPFIYYNGWEQRTIMRLGEMQTLTFSGPVINETIMVNVLDMVPEHAGRLIIFRMPASSPTATFSCQFLSVITPILKATSIGEFNAAAGAAVFQDATHLYIKFTPLDRGFTIHGYTL